ncbi:hypothetical protein [Microtetraspora malaysiensis]|uniref:DUF4192 family protein n=1 Tax=Microtetraspora malaysiensis TaxID=161358 RepID=A0ABW6SN93_9ACTN
MGEELEAALAGPPRMFVLDGDRYELTGSWTPLLRHLTAPSWHMPLLYDLLRTEDADALDDRLADDDDTLTLAQVETIAARLVAAACGRKPWVAARLLGYAAQQWGEIDGALTLRGVDLLALVDTRPATACNTIYAWLVDGGDEKARDKLNKELFKPPPGEDLDASPLWTAEEEGAAFLAAMSAKPGQRPRTARPS